jgi:hypothetical protein
MAFVGMARSASLSPESAPTPSGAPLTVMLSGCVLRGDLVCDPVRMIRKLIRPIYVDLGILPAANVVMQDGVGS